MLQSLTRLDELEGEICYISCTEGGFEVLQNLLDSGLSIDQVVSLSVEQGERNDVAGYHSFQAITAERDIPLHFPESYEMDSDRDVAFFEAKSFDVVVVNGWQRLIGEPILASVDVGAFGLHGSASGLPKGRGRSPMNWSLIEGLDRFLLSIIKLDENIDSGHIIATRKFDITRFDTIRTMYYKLSMATTEMLINSLPSIFDGTVEYTEQQGAPTFYHKRIPEDGAIHWHDSTKSIYNLIRAVTAPYPGAFTETNGTKVYIWKAIPFSTDFGQNAAEGEIVQVFETTGEFVVRTGDGTLLVKDWESERFTPEAGTIFTSLGEAKRADEGLYG
jgi:methionyl-tRNA formyltransferase